MRLDSGDSESRLAEAVLSVGVVLFVLGTLGLALDMFHWLPISGPGVSVDVDLELAGLLAGVGGVAGGRFLTPRPLAAQDVPVPSDRPPVYVARPLVDLLLEYAADREPDPLTVGLAVTAADQLPDAEDLPEGAPVFTHLYFPDRSNSVSSVFGLDLQTPPGRIQGLFLSHPRSALRLTKRDRLHEVVILAVPPWDDDSFAAFDRRGRRRPLRVVDAAPPDEPLPRVNQ